MFSNKLLRREAGFAYLMLIPGILLLLVFTFYPVVRGLPLAFTDYSVIDTTHWVGWKNFKRAFSDPTFGLALKHSLLYVLVVPVLQVISILMAILVNNKLRLVSFFRIAYFVPVVTSMVAAAIAWKWVYEEQGILNYFLMKLHIISEPVVFMVETKLALVGVMIVTVWKGMGYYMMIYLAGLQSIPSEMQEAARIDGANRWRVIWHITIPLLMPFVLLCSLMSVMGAIQVFDEVFVMHGQLGDPAYSTITTSVYSYKVAFADFEFGYAATIGLLVSFIVMAISILMFRYTRKGGLTYYE